MQPNKDGRAEHPLFKDMLSAEWFCHRCDGKSTSAQSLRICGTARNVRRDTDRHTSAGLVEGAMSGGLEASCCARQPAARLSTKYYFCAELSPSPQRRAEHSSRRRQSPACRSSPWDRRQACQRSGGDHHIGAVGAHISVSVLFIASLRTPATRPAGGATGSATGEPESFTIRRALHNTRGRV